MFSQDGHLGNPTQGNFGMVGTNPAKTNGDSCTYEDVLTYDITFNGIDKYTNGYQGGGRNE